MNPTRYRIEWQKVGSQGWQDVFPGQLLAKSEVQEHLEALRAGSERHAPGTKYRVIAISERDATEEFS